jgi:hypothetical protein
MKPEYERNIKYRPDGSIDTAYYMSIGRQKRSEQAHKIAGQASRSLFSAKFKISGKYVQSAFSSLNEKLQGA